MLSIWITQSNNMKSDIFNSDRSPWSRPPAWQPGYRLRTRFLKIGIFEDSDCFIDIKEQAIGILNAPSLFRIYAADSVSKVLFIWDPLRTQLFLWTVVGYQGWALALWNRSINRIMFLNSEVSPQEQYLRYKNAVKRRKQYYNSWNSEKALQRAFNSRFG